MDLKQFLQLFNPLPGNHYLQVCTHIDETTHALYKLMEKVDGEFSIAIYKSEVSDIETQFTHAKVQYIADFKQSFRALPRNHDTVILKDIFHLHENKKSILKIAYTALANTANIIIMEKKGIMNIEAIKEMLETFEFRSSNEVDVLPDYDLIVAKKMHMWGNGL